MRTIHGPAALCFALFLCAAAATGQNDTNPVVSLAPLSSEQLAVYRAVLASRVGNDKSTVNLSSQTVPFSPTDDRNKDCGKGLDMEPASPTLVHQIRPDDLGKLSSAKIKLIDPERGAKEVRENDPRDSIRRGSSVDSAVRNGFAHGLTTLSEIWFDKSHTHAIVAISFYCGMLCGNGSTNVLKKSETGWVFSNSDACGTIWISRLSLPSPLGR